MTYRVRPAKFSDIDWIVKDAGRNLLFSEMNRPEFYQPNTLEQLTIRIISEGVVLILESGTERVGVLGGFIAPHYFNPSLKNLHSVFLYIKPEKRKGRGFQLLLKEFVKISSDNGYGCYLTLQSKDEGYGGRLSSYGFKKEEVVFFKGI